MVVGAARHTWFRFYSEACQDVKVRRLKPAQRWLWVAVLSAASASPERGRLLVAGDLPMTTEELADLAGVKLNEVVAGLELMRRLGMVHQDGDVVVVTNWKDRQYESDSSTQRVRELRERRRNAAGNVAGNVARNGHDVTLGNAPETETETETEKEGGTRKRGLRLPEGWKPTADDIAWARSEKITDFVQRRETEKFVDYWRAVAGGKGVKLDWSLTWRNWLRRVIDDQPQARPAANSFGGW